MQNLELLRQRCTFALAKQKTPQREVEQSGSAPGLGPGGRRFESCRPDTNAKQPKGSAWHFSIEGEGTQKTMT